MLQTAKNRNYSICSKLQNLSYKRQIDEKVSQVEDAFRRIGGLSNFTLEKCERLQYTTIEIKWSLHFLQIVGF